MSSRLAIRFLNLKRFQLNLVALVLTGHSNLQQHKKTTGRAESSLYPKCSLENEILNHHVGNCKLYQDLRVKYFGITKTTVHDVVAKRNSYCLIVLRTSGIKATSAEARLVALLWSSALIASRPEARKTIQH